MKVGDKFTMPVTIRREWWQVWKPREVTVVRKFRVVELAHGGGGKA